MSGKTDKRVVEEVGPMDRRTALVLLLLSTSLLSTGCGDVARGQPLAPTSARTSDTQISTDDGAAITDWLFSTAAGLRPLFLPTLAEIIVKAPRDVRFHILLSAEDARIELIDLLRKRGFADFRRIEWHPVSSEMPWWTRDLFVAGTSRAGDPVIMLHHPDHYGEIHRAAGGSGPATLAILRTLPRYTTVDTHMRIEGGAVVTDADHVFLTDGYCDLAVAKGDFQDWPQFLAHVRRAYGRPVVVLDAPGHAVPRHADMFLTPIGDGVILLGDCALATEILRRAPLASLESFTARLNRIARNHGELRHLAGITPQALIAGLPDLSESRTTTLVLARQLTYLGYRVVLVPRLVFKPRPDQPPLQFTYNNVILDRRTGRRTVFMPVYGLPSLDGAAAEIWSGLGLNVVPVDTVGPALLGGGVRCLSQVFRGAR